MGGICGGSEVRWRAEFWLKGLKKTKCISEDNIKVDLKKILRYNIDWIDSSYRYQWLAFVNTVMV